MEFFYLGAHCSHCKQQDFLPYTCDYCSKKFCNSHKLVNDHQCKEYKPPKENVPIEKVKEVKVLKTCTHKKCEELQMAFCHTCNKGYCLNHRTLETHKCKGLESKTKKTNTVFEMSSLSRDIKRTVDAELKSKKLKEELGYQSKLNYKQNVVKREKDEKIKFSNSLQTPFGMTSIEDEDKFFLKVFFATESNLQPVHWYFNKNKVIGRVIDMISEKGAIPNKVVDPNDPKRLNLYSLQTGECIKDINKALKDSKLKNGDFIVLERGVFGEKLNPKYYEYLCSNGQEGNEWKKWALLNSHKKDSIKV